MTSRNNIQHSGARDRGSGGARRRHEEKKSFWKELLTDTSMGDMDYTFLSIIAGVLAAGLIMLLSASAPRANSMYGNSYYFFIRQFIFAVAGVVMMLIISKIDYRFYRKYAKHAMIICAGMLVLVLIPGIGVERNGARRWLLGVVQPSEFMKPVIAMFFAHLLAKYNTNMRSFKELAPFLGVIIGVVILMIAEPHVSGAIIIIGISVSILAIAGMPVVPIVGIGLVAGAGVVVGSYLFSPTRWARITSFIDPFSATQGASYQIAQSIYSIGSGGVTGLGLGQSVQKFQFLPEPFNDFIFAIVCEELGLIGAIGVIALFALLVIRGIRIALNAPDKYSMLFATGIVAQVAIQSVMNIAVAISAIPNTGVSLPFFSYGGTSLFTLLCEMGVLLNISRYERL